MNRNSIISSEIESEYDSNNALGLAGNKNSPNCTIGQKTLVNQGTVQVSIRHRQNNTSATNKTPGASEQDKALGRAILELMTDHKELLKQSTDNHSFRKSLSDAIFAFTYFGPHSTKSLSENPCTFKCDVSACKV